MRSHRNFFPSGDGSEAVMLRERMRQFLNLHVALYQFPWMVVDKVLHASFQAINLIGAGVHVVLRRYIGDRFLSLNNLEINVLPLSQFRRHS